MAGGILAGGMVVAWLTLTGQLSGFGLIRTSTGLFFFGVGFGFLHGAVLGWLGRPAGMGHPGARQSVGRGLLYAIPAMGLVWVLAGWISQTVVALYLDRTVAMAGVVVAWTAGAVICIWAVLHGWRALRNAYARWEDPALGTVLVAATFVALLLIFLADRPQIWGTPLRVGGMGAVLLAGGVTTWISGPGISLPLFLSRRIPEPRGMARPFPREGAGGGLVMGLLAGGILAGLLLWLAPTSAELESSSTVGVALARALVDEVLLRLFVVTCVVWVLRRWHPLHHEEVAVIAVVTAALAGIVLNLPGMLAAGLPGAGPILAYLGLGLFLPGLVFGGLYVVRGFPSALAGHATLAILLTLAL
jgi:hypothetical protein